MAIAPAQPAPAAYPPPIAHPPLPPVLKVQRPWIAPFLGLFVLALLGAGAIVVVLNTGSDGATTNPGGGIPTVGAPVDTTGRTVEALAKDGLTAAELATVDKTEAFFTYYLNAVQQTKSVLTTEEHSGNSPSTVNTTDTDYYKAGYDYGTKTLAWAHDETFSGITFRQRCDGGLEWRNTGSGWKSTPVTKYSDCTADGFSRYYICDGFLPGGLSPTQADTFVRSLRSHKGLVNVDRLELAAHGSKRYLHFTVELRPIRSTVVDDGSYDGLDLLLFGLFDAGIDVTDLTFEYRGGGGNGYHVDYYIDPGLKLPAYSESHLLAAKDKQGNDLAFTHYELFRTRYEFGTGTFDTSTKTATPITVEW